jgi:hypothetical protein
MEQELLTLPENLISSPVILVEKFEDTKGR